MDVPILIQIICYSIVALLIPIIGILTIIVKSQKLNKGEK